MLIAVEAEIDTNGVVTLLEPVTVTRKTRAVVTLLEERAEESEPREAELPDNALVQWHKAKDRDPNAKFPAKIIAADLPVRDFSREHAWLERHRDEYDGQWVVLDGDKLIVAGFDGKEVARKSRELGLNNAFLTFVEGNDSPRFVSGGLWRE